MMRGASNALVRIKNTPGLVKDLAILAIMIAVGVTSTAVLVGNYEVIPPWEDRFEFSADFDMAPGIQLDSRQEVRIAGINVGKIVDAEPVNGRARLKFSIEGDQEVYRDARLMVRSKTPVNIIYVSLDPGTPKAGRLPAGGTIPASQTTRITQAYEVLDNLDERTRAALGDLLRETDLALTGASENLPGGLDATRAATRAFRPVVVALAERRRNLRHLVTSIAQIAEAAGEDDERLAELVGSVQATLSVVAHRDRQLNASLARLPGFTSTLRDSLTATTALTKELDPVLEAISTASGRLPETLQTLTQTVRTARGLAETARPLIRKARPVVADLRPLVGDLRPALSNLRPVAAALPGATAKLVPWLDNLGAFVYNTSSSFSLGDANGGMGRANVVVEVLEPTGAPIKDVVR